MIKKVIILPAHGFPRPARFLQLGPSPPQPLLRIPRGWNNFVSGHSCFSSSPSGHALGLFWGLVLCPKGWDLLGCPVQGTELDSMNRVSPFRRRIFHGSVIPLSPAGLSHPRQRDQAVPHIPCCPGSSVQVWMPTGDHERGWAGCPQVPSGPSWRQGKAGEKGTASSGQPQFLLCGFTSLWERAQEPCEAWGTQAAPPACPLAVSHAIMHHFWVTTWAWGALCPNLGPHSLHTSDRTQDDAPRLGTAWEQPPGVWGGGRVCTSTGPSCKWPCWRDRISPGGGEEGWLHSEPCWASQTLPAVIVQLVHSAFLMGKHRW